MGGSANNVPFFGTIEGEHELNLQMAERKSEDAKFSASQRIKEADITLGDQMAAAGMNGIVIDGSITDAMKEDYANAKMEADNIIYTGRLDAYQMRRSSQLSRQGAYEKMALDVTKSAIKGAP
jgi:hypothetical protein